MAQRHGENPVRDNQLWAPQGWDGVWAKGAQELCPPCSAFWGFPELFRDEEWCTSHEERGVYICVGCDILQKPFPKGSSHRKYSRQSQNHFHHNNKSNSSRGELALVFKLLNYLWEWGAEH